MGAGAGAATLPRAGSMSGGRSAAADDDREKKKLDPRLLALLPVLLIAGLGSAYFSGAFGSGSTGDDVPPPKDPTTSSSVRTSFGGPPGGSVTITPPMSGPSSGPGPSAPTSSGQPPATYTVLTSPNARFETATLAVTPTQPVSSDSEAVNVARQARQSLKNGRWSRAQIVVFSDRQSAASFVSYMSDRKGAPLDSSNYQELAQQNAWGNAKAFVESNGNRESIRYPYKNPTSWWGG